ncbi:MAG: hypothetical protein K0V04_19910, partial [Deltaproteobacteria bacterium]|nr:hypothetical protein [Deltaproteobacteria bacterium]
SNIRSACYRGRMSVGSIATLAVVLSMVPPPSFSAGPGYTASELAQGRVPLATSQEPEPASEPSSSGQQARTPLMPRLPPPPTDFQRIQGSPALRGINAAAAVAMQLGMIVAGAVSVGKQRAAIRRQRNGQAPPYKPYR